MKALAWYGKRNLKYEDAPEPTPGKGEVKVKISLAGICGTDLREYAEGPCMIPVGKSRVILGHEFAGVVEELGEGVSEFNKGERVTGLGYRICGTCYYCRKYQFNLCEKADFSGLTVDGCMAQYFVAPSFSLYKLPDSVSDEFGTLVEPLAVSLHAVRLGNVRIGDTVSIVGDGPIALCAVLSAKAAGASAIYVVAKHKGRGAIARGFGVTQVIYPSDGDPVKLIRDITNGLGTDVSFECVGRSESVQLAVDLARKGGTTVVIGVFEGRILFDMGAVLFNEKTIIGSPIYVDEARLAIDLLATGRIDPSALITSMVPLENAVKGGFDKNLVDKENNVKILLNMP